MASSGLALRSSSEVIWRLRGSIPSRHTRVSSAPNTAITAPPARTPSTCVRPVGLVPAWLAALRRLSLRCDTGAPSLAQVGLGELLHEDHAEPGQRAELGPERRAARPERRQLPGEVLGADAQDARRELLRAGVAALGHVALEHPREQRRRVLPHVEARVVLDQLEAGHGQRVADAVAEPQPVEHVLDARLDVHEQVEPALLDRQPPAQRVALQVADGGGGPQRVVGEALHVLHLDREVELQRGRVLAAGDGATRVVGLAEGDVAEHLLGEADGRCHVAAASAARRSGSRMWSAKRSASAAMVKLGFGPVGPGITEPSAMCRPGWPNTVPKLSTTPSPGWRPIGEPPSGWTVITRRKNHSGLSAKRPPSTPAMSRERLRTRSKYGAEASRVQSMSSRPSRRCMRPSGMSRPMESRGSPPAESSAGSISSASCSVTSVSGVPRSQFLTR